MHEKLSYSHGEGNCRWKMYVTRQEITGRENELAHKVVLTFLGALCMKIQKCNNFSKSVIASQCNNYDDLVLFVF